ncbi:MAG: Hpt domain-containing protein [Gammaproteobacteria bacterium]|nr:Hpt domain-containing protein [Gammaproteobacteria bacterium]
MAIDSTIFDQLKNDMEDSFLEVTKSILTSIASNLSDLDQRSEKTSTDDLSRYVHSIKSPAACIGATNLATMANKIENDLRQNKVQNLDKDIEELRLQFTLAKDKIKTLISQ